ncbi:MAG: hypothetical protein GX424_01560 [Clostridiales bacterium]|jgi:hypothetical protein|nr:hypothetical protein [Clostridiales bacterium]
MSIKKITLAVGLTLIILMAGCTRGSFITIKSHENNTPTSMSMSYEKFSGSKLKTISLDEPSDVSVVVSTESGSLDISITDKDGYSYYAGTDIPSSSFRVSLDKQGKYEITVNADNHKGSYNISWDKTDKT